MDQWTVHNAAGLESGLTELLLEYRLRLVEVTYRRNLEKRTLALGLKVTGELEEQQGFTLAE